METTELKLKPKSFFQSQKIKSKLLTREMTAKSIDIIETGFQPDANDDKDWSHLTKKWKQTGKLVQMRIDSIGALFDAFAD